MYAIIVEGGGQRRVEQGQEMLVDLVGKGEVKVGQTLTMDKVLVVGETGKDAKVGRPFVSGASVTVEVLEALVKGEKIDILKYRPKKAYKKKQGHRQQYTRVKVTAIKG
jgi:large subunit ribosomal protein L21